MRSVSVVLLLTSLILLVACNNGNAGSPLGLPISVSLTPTTAQTINAGTTLKIMANVANDPSNEGVTWSVSPSTGAGTLTAVAATSATYDAPPTVSITTIVTVTATSKASPNTKASLQISVQSTTTISISLQINNQPAAPLTVNEGANPVTINAVLKNDATNQGVAWTLPAASPGALSGSTSSSVTYTPPVPFTVTANTLVTIQAQSVADPSVVTNVEITVVPFGLPAGSNVAAVNVGTGPVPYLNGVLTSVMVCVPGSTTNCQTVDSVLVDTGSVGLRILASAIPNIAPQLPVETYSADGSQINECLQFMDGSYLWGTVAASDILIGNEIASSVPTHIVADPTGFSIPSSCSTNKAGTDEDNQKALGANGILGVGPEPVDCGLNCDPSHGGTPQTPYYASCTSAQGCQRIFVSCGSTVCRDSSPNQQVTNPVFEFLVDNNGVGIQMPSLTTNPQPTATGFLFFGIGTQANNSLSLTGGNLLPLDSKDEFTTLFDGHILTASFIDSGSSGVFFPNWAAFPTCQTNSQFFCPSSPTGLNVINEGTNNQPSAVTYEVDDADSLIASAPTDEAINNVAGAQQAGSTPANCTSGSGDCTFDFGFPFFYGRTVFTAIDMTPTPGGNGPYFAY